MAHMQGHKGMVIAALHVLHSQGKRFQGDKWSRFGTTLHDQLRRSSTEDLSTTPALLVLTYRDFITALHAVYSAIEDTKAIHGWEAAWGPLPVQTVFAIGGKGNIPAKINETAAQIWGFLKHETPYIAKSLQQEWIKLALSSRLPSADFTSEGEGLLQVSPITPLLFKDETFFLHRDLPVHGDHRECFYCGMRRHSPAACPSKSLTATVNAISTAGYLPVEQFNAAYLDSFTNLNKYANFLATGAEQSIIRDNDRLLVLVAYLDIFQIYQLRYFWRIAFSENQKWDPVFKPDKIKVDNTKLSLALDCLRVGQHKKAEDLFKTLGDPQQGKQFCSQLGLAFLALEQDRQEEFGHHLNIASGMATNEKETAYALLLQIRYSSLAKDIYKAQEILKSLLTAKLAPNETEYQELLLEMQSSNVDSLANRFWLWSENHKEQLFTLAVDPRLMPIQHHLDTMLVNWHREILEDAGLAIEQARREFGRVAKWFTPANEKVRKNSEEMARLERQYERKSIYDAFELKLKAQIFTAACAKSYEESLAELTQRKKEGGNELEKLMRFWNDYPNKYFFANFRSGLDLLGDIINESGTMLEMGHEKCTVEDVLALFKLFGEQRQVLHKLADRMVWVADVYARMQLFSRKIVIAEIILNLAGLAFFSLSGALETGTAAGSLASFLRTPDAKHYGHILLSLVIAPFAALAMTLFAIEKGNTSGRTNRQ